MKVIKCKRHVWLRTSQGFPEWVGEVELQGYDVYMTIRYPSRIKLVARARARISCLKPFAAFRLLGVRYAR